MQLKCLLCRRSFEARGRGRRAYCKQCNAKADAAIGRKTHADCKECGKRFVAARSTSRYCSPECRTAALRRYNREYQRRTMADPEKRAIILARNRASAAAARAAGREGGASPGPPKAPQRANTKAEPSICGMCGRSFFPYGRANHAYCKRCTAKADREIARRLHAKCKECGKAFATANSNVRYCSKACSANGARRSRRESRRRRMADPERRAIESAYVRAWYAAQREKKQAGEDGAA